VIQKVLIDIDGQDLGHLGGDQTGEQARAGSDVGYNHRGPKLAAVDDILARIEDFASFFLEPFDV